MEQRQAIVYILDLLTPARIFMNFVYIQIFPATGEETLGSINKSVRTEVDIICNHVKGLILVPGSLDVL